MIYQGALKRKIIGSSYLFKSKSIYIKLFGLSIFFAHRIPSLLKIAIHSLTTLEWAWKRKKNKCILMQ